MHVFRGLSMMQTDIDEEDYLRSISSYLFVFFAKVQHLSLYKRINHGEMSIIIISSTYSHATPLYVEMG